MGFTVNGNSLLNGDGLLGLANTIDDNGNSLGSGNHSNGGGVKRKREKLDHLTEEEKLMRRKLKNRISAQTARDRKKEKLTDLESKVAQISKINCILLKENAELKKQLDLSKTSELRQLNDKLEAENKMLKERLTALEEKVNGSIIKMDTSEDNSNNIKNKKQATPLKPNNLKSEANYASPVFEKSKVDSIESAEEPGANQRDLSDLDQAINSLINSDGDECEEIIKWLHRCSEQLLDQGIEQLSDDSGIEDSGSHTDETVSRLSPTSEEPKERDLESMRDLITFDHMYHRNDLLTQPQINEMTIITTPSPTLNTKLLTDNSSSMSLENTTKTTTSTLSPDSNLVANNIISNNSFSISNQPNELLVNNEVHNYSEDFNTILPSPNTLFEPNLNIFDDLFPELI